MYHERTKQFYCGDDVYLEGNPMNITIHEDEDEDLFSGLYDAEGLPLYHTVNRIKPGFI